MLNKQLFAAKASTRATVVNEAGGKAYGLDPRQALAQLALTGTLNDVFYADAQSQLDQLLARCFDVSPEFVAKTAIYARQHGRMKDVPVVLLAWLASFDGELCAEAFQRVIDAKTIRCGYFVWPPYFSKDVKTGEYGGIYYDLLEAIGKKLSLKIEWVEEVPWANMFEGLSTGRHDAICGPMFPTAERARVSDFTMNIVYAPTYLYARADDSRFDNKWDAINDPAVKFAILEGEANQTVAKENFPKANVFSSTNMADGNQIILDIAAGKADVTALEPVQPDRFMKANPGQIKRVEGGPVRLQPLAIPIVPGEYRFKRMMDITIQDLQDSGVVDKIFKKHLEPHVDVYRIAPGYVQP